MRNILDDVNFTLLEGFSNTTEGQYSKYIQSHVDNVKKGYQYIKDNIPELLNDLEIDIDEMDKQIEAHDKSKWGRDEFKPYAEHFYGETKGLDDDPAFSKAWEHHYNNNPHHPEYWGKSSEMPYSCLLEMLCDWWSFSFKDGNLMSILDYDNSNPDAYEHMHPKSIKKFKSMLEILKNNLKKYSNTTLAHIEKSLTEGVILSEAVLKTKELIDTKHFKIIDHLIKSYNRIVLCRHISPDADAFGCVKALNRAISTKYPKKEIIVSDEGSNILVDNDTLVIVLDTPNRERIAGNIIGFENAKTIRIDHHPSGFECDETLEIESAGSACELITLFLDDVGYNIDKKIGEDLFRGIITDTGRMQYSLEQTTLAAISILAKKGVDYKKIYNQLYVKDEISLKSKAYILGNYKTLPNGTAYLYIDESRANNAGVDMEKVMNQVYEMGEIKGSPIWVIIGARGNGKYNMRVRSRTISIRDVCERFGGGGHDNACGISVNSTDKVKEILIALDASLGSYKNNNRIF